MQIELKIKCTFNIQPYLCLKFEFFKYFLVTEACLYKILVRATEPNWNNNKGQENLLAHRADELATQWYTHTLVISNYI